ncbi:MAG: YaeQ family protein [Candidatus Thiodiazotropha sp.]
MALKATIFKAELQLSDMDRHHYDHYALTLARHPSETDERMLLRLAAFAYHADPRLEFTRGISTEDEPDLWQKSLSDEIELWIELGQPDEKRIRRACGRARKVIVYPYAERSALPWWQQNKDAFARFKHLEVRFFSQYDTTALPSLVQRNMALTATIQEGQLWLSDGQHDLTIQTELWQHPQD